MATLILLAIGQVKDAAAASPFGLKQLLAKVPIERAEKPFREPLRLVHIESAAGGGWSGVLDDRWNSSDAFRGNYRDEFLEGLSYYLQTRGFELSSESSALVVRVTIDEFEGRKRIHDDGGDLRGSLMLLRNGNVVGKKDLFESLSYRDEADECRAFAKEFDAQGVRFPTVLFYRLSVSFYRSIEAGILEASGPNSRPGVPAGAAQGGQSPQPAATEGKSESGTGLLTIESSPEAAEILLDGKLVATTPAVRLRLPAGGHTLVLRKRGYQEWTREIMVLSGNDLTLKASLEKSTE